MSQPRIHQQWSQRDLLYRLVDLAGILGGNYLVAQWWPAGLSEMFLLAGVAASIIYYLMSEFSGTYRNWLGESTGQEMFCVSITWLLSIPFLLALSVMTHYTEWVSRVYLFYWSFASLALILSTRVLLRQVQAYLRARGYNSRAYAVVGVNELGFDLARRIERTPELGLKLAGFYDDRSDERLPEVPDEFGQKLGSMDQLLADAKAGRISRIYITFPMRAEHRIRQVLSQLSDSTASVYLVPDFFVFQLLHSRWTNINGLPAVSVFENPFYGVDGLLKRLVDVAFALVLLIALALPMCVIALLVKLSSPGPIFFRQKRYGLDGCEILVWKFRSMTVCESGDKFTQAVKNDPRTTRIGAILRRTSLDELPQLFNVLEGSMSLVGPRPHATMQNEAFRTQIEGYMLRHKVKPGMTGLAQVNGWRGETDTLEKMEKRVEFDHRYIREWSLLMDLKILFQTIFVVLSRQNAY